MKVIELLEYNLSQKQKRNALDEKATIIITMPPKMFLDLTTSYKEHSISLNMVKDKALSKEQYQKDIDNSKITIHPFLDIDVPTGFVDRHDGRSRAFAAMQNGDKDYEVAIRLSPWSRKYSLKDIPNIWIGQFDPNIKINFRQEIANGTIKILDDNVQKVYQKESVNESVINGIDTYKAWYDSVNRKLHLIPEGLHHTEYLFDYVSNDDFIKICGNEKENYQRKEYSDTVIEDFYEHGWVRLGYEYGNQGGEFYADGNGTNIIARGVSLFYKSLEKNGEIPDAVLFLNDKKLSNHDELRGNSFFKFLKTGVITKNMRESEEIINEYVLSKDSINIQSLKILEKEIDNLFHKANIDVIFSNHFKERIFDPRNISPITYKELTKIFVGAYKKYAKQLSYAPNDFEAVFSDISTLLNIPFVLKWNDRTKEWDLVTKTIMRKKDFYCINPKLQIENKHK